MAIMLTGALTVAQADFPDTSGEYTQSNDGCTEGPIDPIGTMFKGDAAGLPNTVASIEAHTGWDTSSGSDQKLRVKVGANDYGCRTMGDQRSNHGPFSGGFHARLWFVEASQQGPGEKKTMGSPHHEDLVPCPIIPNHAVDSNGSNGSGFDRGRQQLREQFSQAGHSWNAENWGNTRNFQQCDGDYAGSNGTGTIISIGHQH